MSEIKFKLLEKLTDGLNDREKKLLEKEKLFDIFVKELPLAVMITTDSNVSGEYPQITFLNKGVFDLLGIDVNSDLSIDSNIENVFKQVSPDKIPEQRELFYDLINKKYPDTYVTYSVLNLRGTIKHVFVYMKRIEYNECPSTLSIAFDISKLFEIKVV